MGRLRALDPLGASGGLSARLSDRLFPPTLPTEPPSPAVVGAASALTKIEDGAQVTVDPTTGSVSLV